MKRIERPDEIELSFWEVQQAIKAYILEKAGVEVGHISFHETQRADLGLPTPQFIATAPIKDPT